MNRILSCLCALMITTSQAILAVPDPNPGGVVDVTTYFPMTGAGCMNPTATLSGLAIRNRAATPGEQCAGTGPMFFVFHGVPAWSTESFFIEDGWLKNYEEIFYYSGGVDNGRVFRDHASGRKGMKWMPASWDASSSEFWEDDLSDIDYYDNNGPCYGAPIVGQTPAAIGYGSAYTLTFPSFLSDGRTSNRTNPAAFSTPQTVYAVVRSGTWIAGDGTHITEDYYYGKFWSVSDNQWYGLGLVKYEKFVGGSLTDSTENRYLVNCSVGGQCNSCPDP